MTTTRFLLFLAALGLSGQAAAEDLTVQMHKLTESGTGEAMGEIQVTESPYGALFIPAVKGLPPGLHGFHIHENPDCGPGEDGGETKPGLAAGGHFDPEGTGRHEGPYGEGHLGDLPALFVDEQGQAGHTVLAPRVKLEDLKGRALIIHEGGDTYAEPPKLGGGGARLACGVVE